MGSISYLQMYPLDFEEFLIANGINHFTINTLRQKFEARKSLKEKSHNKMIDLFHKHLRIEGISEVVNSYLSDKNIRHISEIQREIHDYYATDASKYDSEYQLKIRRIYDMTPSNLENKKKHVISEERMAKHLLITRMNLIISSMTTIILIYLSYQLRRNPVEITPYTAL